MVLGKHFVENLQKRISVEGIYYYSVIEPPVFGDDERDWKSIADLGTDFESFHYEPFFEEEQRNIENNNASIQETDHTSFFLCVNREVLLEIGGLDPLFNPMFCEDDDLILRLRLLGLKTYLVKDAIAYHFVSKTSRFSEEYKDKTGEIEKRSHRNFVRKWGFLNHSNTKAKYDIGIVLKDATLENIRKVEPFASMIYADIEDYLKEEQRNTSILLADKIKSISEFENHGVEIWIYQVNEKTERELSNLADIITERIRVKKMKNTCLKRMFYRIVKPYKLDIIIQNSQRLEHTLIRKKIC